MLSREEFLAVLSQRPCALSVGCELGVSKQLVCDWKSGYRKPSKTVLLLAELLWRAPRDLPAGLPDDGQDQGG
jgi:DNA-binding transcriptional regulator YiaG